MWCFYDRTTGLFADRKWDGPRKYLELNTRANEVAIEGEFDHISQRVDVATGQVVDFRPPAPDADHEWNESLRRYTKRADVIERENRDARARVAIAALEASSARATREALLELLPQNSPARARLQIADDEIAAERPNLIPRK